MEHICKKIEELRQQYPVLQGKHIPIDIFTFFEIDLELEPIPFDDLILKYDIEAAISADFKSIYVDAEQYSLMEKGPVWKLNRLRFTIAHELAHYFLHQDIPRKADFSLQKSYAVWNQNYRGRKYEIEREANEFAGNLLVPKFRLEEFFNEFANQIENLVPNFIKNDQLRDQFTQSIAQKFMVNSQVIGIRLDREQIWPAD